MLEGAAVVAGAVDGAEQLVEEVAVAVLDVDEVEPGVAGAHGGVHEVDGQAVELAVGEAAGDVGRDAPVELGMAAGDQRPGGAVGSGPASGVGELEADDEVVVAPGGAVRVLQAEAEVAQQPDRAVVDDELVGVGPPVVADGHRLAAPDELGPALAEALPPAADEVGRPAVGGAVPALHRAARRSGCRPSGCRSTRR